jgi:hypothetical protein
MRDIDKGLGARLFDLQLNYVTFILSRHNRILNLYMKGELISSYVRLEIMLFCDLCVLWTCCSKTTSMK